MSKATRCDLAENARHGPQLTPDTQLCAPVLQPPAQEVIRKVTQGTADAHTVSYTMLHMLPQ